MINTYVKSALNYTGGKFKLLPQIIPLFPKEIDTFVDLFGGGFNVGINVKANAVLYNDTNTQVVEMLEFFKNNSVEDLLRRIDSYVEDFNLSKTNRDGFTKLRELYNIDMGCRTPMLLYTLMCYAFNNQIRFNSKGEYNMPFGKDRSSFNPTLREKFITFVTKLHSTNIVFSNKSFENIDLDCYDKDDFFYIDPPYFAGSTATYNENGGWTEKNEIYLLEYLDRLTYNDIRFALSNVLEHNGYRNELLIEWSKDYNVHNLNHNYSNCSYHKKEKGLKTQEVLITNY